MPPAGRDWLVRRSRCCAGLSSGMDSQADRMPSVRIVTNRTPQGFPVTVDRAAGEEYARAFPGIVDVARASRQFLTRTIRYLAGEAGIRQFLDVGTGLPTAENTHEVAQRAAPESRI